MHKQTKRQALWNVAEDQGVPRRRRSISEPAANGTTVVPLPADCARGAECQVRAVREEGRVPANTLKNKEGYQISPALSSVQASCTNESKKYPAWSLRKHAAIGRWRRGWAGAWWRCRVRGILAPTITRINGICSVALSAQMGRRGRTIHSIGLLCG